MKMMPVIQTNSNKAFSFVDPRPGQVCIEDIAHALSLLCRYTGHSNRFYSVGQHSLLVAHLTPKPFKLEALLHDAPEAYIGDISSPLKQLLLDYQRIEHNVTRVVRGRFNLPPGETPCVKRADTHALAIERASLLPDEPFCAWDWIDEMGFNTDGYEDWLAPMTPEEVKEEFMVKYFELGGF